MDQKGIVLIVDDDKKIIINQKYVLEKRLYKVHTALSGNAALNIIRNNDINVLITDIRMNEMNGIELIRKAIKIRPFLQCILITAYRDYEPIREAINLGGAVIFHLHKPIDPDDLDKAIQKALDNQKRIHPAGEKLANADTGGGIQVIGRTEPMKKIKKLIAQVAGIDSTVLITGETGTGKDLVAKVIHEKSPRSQKPFIIVDCTSLPETLFESALFGHVKGAFTDASADRMGKFEEAAGSSIFLDEIGDISLNTQVKLLRVIQEKKFQRLGSSKTMETDCRILAATNRNLEEMIQDGTFRKDLYFRLKVINIFIPPLRERKEDISLLVDHFMNQLKKRFGKKIEPISEGAIKKLMEYNWPGNVRELKHAIERAIILTEGSIIENELINSIGSSDKNRTNSKEPENDIELEDFIVKIIKKEKSWDDSDGSIYPKYKKLEKILELTYGDIKIIAECLHKSPNYVRQILHKNHLKLKDYRRRH